MRLDDFNSHWYKIIDIKINSVVKLYDCYE